MTLDDRVTIQECLNQNISISKIAKRIGKNKSSVLREIQRHRVFKGRRYAGAKSPCLNKATCSITGLCKDKRCVSLCKNCIACKDICSEYFPSQCERLKQSPHVCNGCNKVSSCTYENYFYYASYAHNSYQDTLISSREGINQDPEMLQELDDLISPLLRKGQSVDHILANHLEDINCSRSTIYRYVNESVLTAKNIDMPRKVRYKRRAKTNEVHLTKEQRLSVLSRSYDRFKKYIEEHPDTDVVEMDTVIGVVGSHKAILTLLFRSCNLMIMFLLENKTQESVVNALNWLSDNLGVEVFRRLFPVILTDRGIEFLYPEAIECDANGEIKTKLFYCDPQCSWQKGTLEKNHEFIRYVLPKGSSFDALTQEDITLLTNHINSLAREKYHGKTPYMLSTVLLENKLYEVMKLVEIKPDDVFLKPALLNKHKQSSINYSSAITEK